MVFKKAAAMVMALCCVLWGAGMAAAAEVDSGSVYCFSQEDFSGEETLTGICITDVPLREGKVMLGDRELKPGDILTAQQVAQMTFCPARTEKDDSTQVGYLPIYETHVEEEAAMTIGIRGKADHAPIAEDQSLETYKNLSTQGKLKVSDPEGEPMKFQVLRGAKRGDVQILEDGTFTYTPKKNKVGIDSFTYTATDSMGKTSREATVTITILKPADETQYTDTMGKECRFTAEWMKNTGIFVGEQVGESPCFSPEKQVSRGEFVAMLVKALKIPAEEEVSFMGYKDEIPAWLQPYLKAAVRAGLTADLPDQETFGPDMPITGAEASVMLCNALDLNAAQAMSEDGQEVSWAASSLNALEREGISLDGAAPLSRSQVSQALYQAVKLQAGE